MKFVAAAAAVAAALVAFSTPAGADSPEQDYRFITTMQSLGWHVSDPTEFTGKARMVCNEGLQHGVTWQEMQTIMGEWGYKPLDADYFIYNAIGVYCPQYAASTTDEIHDDMLRH